MLKQFNQNHRNLPYLAELSIELQLYNSFFRNLDELVICCLLKCSSVREYKKGSYIYSKGEESK